MDEGGWGSEIPLDYQSTDNRGTEIQRGHMTGYEIKYSMSALFWSPRPSSTLTDPAGGEDVVRGETRCERRRW